MRREEIENHFSGRNVTLVLDNDFVISGLIECVYSDSVLFTTNQKSSLIRFDRIREIRANHKKKRW